MMSFTPSETAPTMMAMRTPVTSARMAMVRYWRFRKAMAPSKIMEETSRIASVPVSRRSTSQASQRAKTTPANPATGTSHTSSIFHSLLSRRV